MESKKKYFENVYTRISKGGLILVSIYYVLEKEKVCTFERLIAECFTLFPKVFSFKRYPQWPDSLKFDRTIRTLRKNGLINGSSKGYLTLTLFGKQKALDIKMILENKKSILPVKNKHNTDRSSEDRLITYLKHSEVFNRYLKSPSRFHMSEPEFINLLRCTLESPQRILKQNLEYYKKISEEYSEKELLHFLTLCEKKFIKK